MASRMGKHRLGKSSIGLYVDDDFRALLALVSKVTGRTQTDLLMDGVKDRATALGIISDGKISPEFESSFDIVKSTLAARRCTA